MKFHNIRMVGPFNNEHLASLPTFDTSKDPGRMVWLNDGSLWYGETDRWVKILASDNGGNTRHNDLVGRSDNDCHPISAITGLEEALRYAGMRWELVDNTSWTVQDHVGYLVDTTGGAVTATLPAVSGMAPSASLGMVTEIVDMAGSFDSNEVTVVTPDNALIMGLNESLEIDTEWASATLVYSDSAHGWIVTDGKSGGCQGGGGLGGMQWNIVDANTSAQPFNGYFVDTETRSVRMTLSSTPEEGDIVKIIDYNGFAHTNNIIVDANGKKIAGSTNDLTLNVNNTSLTLIYSDAEEGWVIESIYKDTGLQWNKINSNTNALPFNGYFVDTENISVTLTLPSSPKQGTIVKVIDYNGFANTNNIFIDPNGDKINGDTNAFVMDVDRGSVTFIYSDNGEGWLIDNAYKTSETGGGIIDTPITVYLAPDSVSKSPTGKIGSDITGDGSYDRPFFSIKRAIEYLNDYRIKSGVFVTIYGLPGKYDYYDQHKVVMEHKDTKFIKVQFAMYDSGNNHETTMTDDAITVTNHTGYDLITFTVDDMGTGFYQFQTGDYIKILTSGTLKTTNYNAPWNGYFEVTSVDVSNKTVTIKYPTHRLTDTSYYIIPSTKNSSYSISVYKLSTHVYSHITSGYFIYSEYGFGSIQMNASSSNNNANLLYVYDGIVNDVILNINNFDTGFTAYNLTIKFLTSLVQYESVITACKVGLDVHDGVINATGLCGNLCYYVIHMQQTSFTNNGGSSKMSLTNCIVSIYSDASIFEYNKNTTYSYMVNVFGCSTGVYLMNNSSWYSCGNRFDYNRVGFSLSNSEAKFYGYIYDADTYPTLFYYNSADGVRLTNNATFHFNYVKVGYNNDNGISCDNSSITTNSSVWNEGLFYLRDNGGSGIYIVNNSFVSLYNVYIYNNDSYGIYMEHSSIELKYSVILGNDLYGIRLNYESNGFLYNVDIRNNLYGINIYNDSRIYMINTDGTNYKLSDNTNQEVYALDNSTATIRLKNTLSTTSDFFPAANTAPTYDYNSYTRAGAYILYRDES